MPGTSFHAGLDVCWIYDSFGLFSGNGSDSFPNKNDFREIIAAFRNEL
jgi:hypothetical protein